jgi:hypothetical protein
MIIALLCLIFPFKEEYQPGGSYPTLFGSGVAKSYRITKNGFQLPFVLIEHGLMLITAALMVFSARKIFKIFSLIMLLFVNAFLLVMHFGLTFQLYFFGPSKIIHVGTGYFFLTVVVVCFTGYTIYAFVKSYKLGENKLHVVDLLDDPLSE